MVVQMVFNVTRTMVTVRTHNKLMRDINRRAMEKIRDEYWPRHFTLTGYYEYGFKSRSVKYSKRKQRQVGHELPNVLTGQLRTHVLTNSKITATRNRGRLYAKANRPLKAEQRRELEIVSRREKKAIARWMKREYIRMAKLPEYKATRRRRGKNGRFV